MIRTKFQKLDVPIVSLAVLVGLVTMMFGAPLWLVGELADWMLVTPEIKENSQVYLIGLIGWSLGLLGYWAGDYAFRQSEWIREHLLRATTWIETIHYPLGDEN